MDNTTRGATATRDQLRDLAEGVLAGTIRRGLATEIVPLEARSPNALGDFDALVEAIEEHDEVAAGHLLDLLVGSTGESCGAADVRHVGEHGAA